MKLTLVSKEGEKFEANFNTINYSKLVASMVEENEEDEEEYEDLPMAMVDSEELKLIIDYCEYHVAGKETKLEEINPIEQPLKSTSINDVVPEWYANFILNVAHESDDNVFKLMNAANYMQIHTLIELCCAYIGTNIKGKNPKEIREHFGITDDFTQEEKEAFVKEHEWIKKTL